MFDQFITKNIISNFWHNNTNGTITKNEKIVTNVKSIFQRSCFNSFQLTELVKCVRLRLRNGKNPFNFLQKNPDNLSNTNGYAKPQVKTCIVYLLDKKQIIIGIKKYLIFPETDQVSSLSETVKLVTSDLMQSYRRM